MKLVRGKGFEPLNLYGWDLKSHAFGQLDYPRANPPKTFFDITLSNNAEKVGFGAWYTLLMHQTFRFHSLIRTTYTGQ